MSNGGEKFNPVEIMLTAHRNANRDRKRITHWRVNYAAVDEIAMSETLMRNDYSTKPILEREFLGIPLQLDRDDRSGEPNLEPVFETYGRNTLIHDYDGPIAHGNDLPRFLSEVREAMMASKPKGDDDH